MVAEVIRRKGHLEVVTPKDPRVVGIRPRTKAVTPVALHNLQHHRHLGILLTLAIHNQACLVDRVVLRVTQHILPTRVSREDILRSTGGIQIMVVLLLWAVDILPQEDILTTIHMVDMEVHRQHLIHHIPEAASLHLTLHQVDTEAQWADMAAMVATTSHTSITDIDEAPHLPLHHLAPQMTGGNTFQR